MSGDGGKSDVSNRHWARLAELYSLEIESARKEGHDNLRSWLAALSVANGAGLFGIFTVAVDGKATQLLYVSLPSAWIFLLGLAAASASSFGQLALSRKQEEYWRLSDVERIVEENNLPNKPEHDIEKIDRETEAWGQFSGYAAILSALAFLVGVGVPLTNLTLRALSGNL